MKTKIKNEFQNPDLIFGNENQKRKLKLKNKILKSIMACVVFIALITASMLDSVSYIPFIVLSACIAILTVFIIANWDMIIRKYDLPYREDMKMKKRIEKIMSCFVYVLALVWILSVIILGYSLFSKISKNETDNQKYYADLLQVTNIDYSTNEITFKNSNGFVYNYTKYIDDIYIGDYYNALMMESGKENDVRDDIIVNIRYERPDLFVDN